MTKLIVILGPTASGKTDLSLALARELGAEVVAADSMQVYRYMDIGTAKPTAQERHAAPHHLLDVVDPDQPFDAALYCRLADQAIADIQSRRRPVLVVGGTGLYLKALERGLVEAPGRLPEVRAGLEEHSNRTLHDRLASLDPTTAAKVSPNDRVRLIRSLEIMASTSQPVSQLREGHGFAACRYSTFKIGCFRERPELVARIRGRAQRMMELGLREEVQGLLDRGYGPDLNSMGAIGYSQMVQVIQGRLTLDEATELIEGDTRRYAKRQMTWFKRDQGVIWTTPPFFSAELLGRVRGFLEDKE